MGSSKCSVNKIAVFYGHVASNLGDLAINAGELAALKRTYPNAEVMFIALHVNEGAAYDNAMAETARIAESKWTIYRTSFRHVMNYLSNPAQFLSDCGAEDADLIVLASGEHLFAYSENANTRALYWRTLPALAAKVAGKRCMLFPSTFGPFETAESRSWMTALFQLVDGYAVRESGSARALEKTFGLQPQQLPDPAFFLVPRKQRDRSKTDVAILGFAMRAEDWGIRLSSEQRRDTLDGTEVAAAGELAFQFVAEAALRFLSKRPDGQVRVFVQTTADQKLAERLSDYIGSQAPKNHLEIITPNAIPEYLDALAELDALIASRFHALIMGLLVSVPVYGVYFPVHGHKIPGLFSWLGLNSSFGVIECNPSKAAFDAVEELLASSFDWGAVDTILHDGRNRFCEWIDDVAKGNPSGGMLHAVLALNELAKELIDRGYKQEQSAQKEKIIRRLEGELDKKFENWKNKFVAGGGMEQGEVLRDNNLKEIELERGFSHIKQSDALLGDEQRAMQDHFEMEREKLLSDLSTKHRLDLGLVKEQHALRLEEECRALRAELSLEHARFIDELTSKHESRINAMKKEQDLRIARMTQQHDALKKSTAAKLQKLQNDWEQLSGAHSNLLRDAAQLRGQLAAIRDSTSFQMAAEAARTFRSRRKILTLPIRLHAIYSEARTTKKGEASLVAAIEQGTSLAAGVAAIEENSISPIEAAAELARQSKALSEQGLFDDACEVASRALELHRSETTLRAMFWAQQRAGQVEDAFRTVQSLQNYLGDRPSLMQKERLDFIRSQPSFQLNLQALLPAMADTAAYEPVKGRLAYVLHNSLPFSSGGYATRAQGLAKGLLTQGYEVIAFTRPGYPMDINKSLQTDEVSEIQEIDGVKYVRTLEPSRKNLRMHDFMPIATDVMVAHFQHYKPEVIVAASNYICALPALFASRKLGLPFVYEVRGFWEITRVSREPGFINHASYKIQELMEAFVCQQADQVLTLTEAMKEELIRRGVDGKKIDIVPNACQPELFEPRQRDVRLASSLGIPPTVPVIGYIGTFVDYEGLDDLARACGILKGRGLEFRLLMVGNENVSGTERGPIGQAVLAAAKEYDFLDWLIMPGRVPHEEVADYYSLIDIAPFPRKPWPVCEMVSPMKPLEAMAMEKAVVVSSVSALAEMAGYGNYGVIFEKGSDMALADALASVLADAAWRQKLGKAGREHVLAERTWLRSAQRFAQALPQASLSSKEAVEP